MPTTITLTGFKEFEAKLANMPKILESEIGGEVRYAAEEWAGFAKRDAPKDVGFLAGGIDAKHLQPLVSEVTSNAEYSAYMEWGTKTRVHVPGDLLAYAATFKGKGIGGGNMKDLIFSWCKRKGIAPNLWWPIFISIARFGVHAHPFFFIQVPLVEKQLFENVKRILTTEH
jgi:hypothetical protein